jgi:uncharacterized membrane protein
MHNIRGVKSMKAKLMIIAAGLLGLAVLSLTEEALALTPLHHVCEENAQGYTQCDYNWN